MNIKPKILLVDPNPDTVQTYLRLLSAFEAEILQVYTGEEAIHQTHHDEFALVLMEVQLPDLDGYETVKRMHHSKQTRYLPVIFLSNIFSDNHHLIEGIETGAVDFIAKPIIPWIFKGKVKNFIEFYMQQARLQNEIECRKLSEEELRRAEQELLEAKFKAEHANKLKSIFLSNMSHELRTPLNSIIGFAGLLREKELTTEVRKKYIDYINNSGETLLTLINDIIDFSKIEADQLKVTTEPVKIYELLEELYQIYQGELIRRNKANLIINLVVPEVYKNLVIQTDLSRLRQILSNLLMNAVKYTSEGSIDFGIEINEPDWVHFYVTDTGIGIAPEYLANIFERFFQVEPLRPTHNYSGTGLGLAITKKLTELLNGKIRVESQVDYGSSFIVSFPIASNNNKLPHRTEPHRKPEMISEFEILSNQEILIAEDEEINFYFLKEALRNEKVKIYWGKNGFEAVELFKKHPHISIVLMDIKMPVMDGYEALRRIKNIRDVPVIAQTAFAMEAEKDIILKAGFDEYLNKPISISLLNSIIVKFLTKEKSTVTAK